MTADVPRKAPAAGKGAPSSRRRKDVRKRINLALQGGGAHGAFTWGVIDGLLEGGRITLAAVSGASAGAMNAVVLAEGMTRGGPDGARRKLHEFWRAISDAARYSPVQRALFDILTGTWSLDRSPGYLAFDAATHLFSPYEFNPCDINPLRDVLESCVDFSCVRDCHTMQLYISATNVHTGRVKVFDSRRLTADMVMASACLPFLFKAVVIDGVPYWDGGYMGNPPLFPFHNSVDCTDIVIVQINPVARKTIPATAREIQNRQNEIVFNASLLRELRAIDFVARLIDGGVLDPTAYRRERVHIIQNQEALNPLAASSKLNAEWAFLTHLHDIGRETAARWLDRNFDAIGNRSTVDIRAMFQGTEPGAEPARHPAPPSRPGTPASGGGAPKRTASKRTAPKRTAPKRTAPGDGSEKAGGKSGKAPPR